MRLFPEGDRIFEVISRYDDLLALEGKEGYEPGDTLALIVPFLIYHGITEADITALADQARLVSGAHWLISGLNSRGWGVYCISTSYQQYAHRICQRVGIAKDRLACTLFDLDRYLGSFSKSELSVVEQLERGIKELRPVDDDLQIKQKLDRFFWGELTHTKLGEVLAEIKPVGGGRKVAALQIFAAKNNLAPSDWVVVGDSITDARMLQAVDEAGGLAIAFNANEYALHYATMGLASTNLDDLDVALRAWEEGGRQALEKVVKEMERAGGEGDRNHFHWLSGRENLEQPLSIHKRIRSMVRRQAAKLG
jgi:energy-converting hydrogenase A subunit R